MKKSKLQVSWNCSQGPPDFTPILKRFERYLQDQGYRTSTILGYVSKVSNYLRYVGNEAPTPEDAAKYRNTLLDMNLKRSTLNNYAYAMRAFHAMKGEKVHFPFLTPNNKLPYFFDEADILKIFDVCHNMKHRAMLTTLFYGCLRASELCALDDSDIDLEARTLRIREGKGGKESIIPINEVCVRALREYLGVRPPFEIDGRHPLFYTDFGRLWDRKDLYRMFIYYKGRAGIKKPGGLHTFARHSAASILIKNGCDIMTVKELLRHEHLTTTARYLHITQDTTRAKYEAYLVL